MNPGFQKKLELESLSSSGPTAVAQIHKDFDLEEVLQCPICFEICQPPIYICVSGHSLCKRCHKKVGGKCPYCRKPVKDGRNFALEMIYHGTQFACAYKDQGCQDCPKGGEFQNHVDVCPKRPFTCQYGKNLQCLMETSVTPFDNLLTHFVQDHAVPKLYSGRYCSHNEYLIPDLEIPMACWEFDGMHFLERVYQADNILYINILLIGEKFETDKYQVDLHIIRQGLDCAPNLLKGIYPIEVKSIREPFQDIKKGSLGFSAEFFRSDVAKLDLTTKMYLWMTRVDFKLKNPQINEIYHDHDY